MLRRLILFVWALPCASCTLVCGFEGVPQPCDSHGDCLGGFVCRAGICVPGVADAGSGNAGGGPQCLDDSDCLPAGACSAGSCETASLAWEDGGASTPRSGCYPSSGWPGAGAVGKPFVPLSGCISAVPGQSLGQDGGFVQVFEKGFPLGDPVTVEPDASCPEGWGYLVMAPAGQLLDLAVQGPEWVATDDESIELDAESEAGGGRRDLVVWTAASRARELVALGGDPDAGLIGGVVRDCAGRPLSAVTVTLASVSLPDAGAALVYLGPSGAPQMGREATGSTGVFAAAVPPGDYEIAFSPAGSSVDLSQMAVTVGASAWIDVAPRGP